MAAVNSFMTIREKIPWELMFITRKPFHKREGTFPGLDLSKPIPKKSLGFTSKMLAIGREIQERFPNIPWVSFSPKAMELGVKDVPRRPPVKIIRAVIEILDHHGFQPDLGAITFRS